jgi:hypothetical protein
MRTVAFLAASVAALVSFSGAANAGALSDRLAVDLGIGTTGVGVQGEFKVSRNFVLRAEGDLLEFRDAFTSSDVRYAGRAHLNTAGAFVDWHPTGAPWLLSAGVVAGRRKVDVRATSAGGSIKIDGVAFAADQIGSVQGAIDLGSAAPFVGLGWDNTFITRGPIGFRAIAGVIIGPDPTVNLTAIGPFATNSVVVADLIAEQSSLQHDIRDLQYYPVVQLGLTYRF